MKKVDWRKTGFEFAQMILGNAICAFALACFALPFDMVVSGMGGIGRVINTYTGISVSVSVAVLNIALFIIAWLMLGTKFAASIAIGTFAYPFFLGIFQSLPTLQHLVDDPLLAAICAGVLDGVGLGLVIRIGGSTGGIDIPSIILNRKLGWKVATVMSTIDVCIFLMQILTTKTYGIILGILYALIYNVVMNQMILTEQGGIQIMVWTSKTAEVNEELLALGFGTTLFKAEGGYLHQSKEVICCTTGNRTFNKAKRAILGLDSKAFITITPINEVNGNGFTLMLGDEKYVPEFSERKRVTEQVTGRVNGDGSH